MHPKTNTSDGLAVEQPELSTFPVLPRTLAAFGSREVVQAVQAELHSRYPQVSAKALQLFAQDRGRIFRYWYQLHEAEREALLLQVSHLDLELMERNLAALQNPALLQSRTAGTLTPPELHVVGEGPEDLALAQLGEEVLQEGWLAVVEGAGGTGSRFFKAAGEHPKGLYHISPSEQYSFFEVRLSHLMALRRLYGKPIPYLVMVSDATREQTLAYFEAHQYFGLRDEIRIVQQRSLPYLDEVAPGVYDLVLEAPHKVAVGGYGHADFTKHVLLQPDVVAWLRSFGVRYVQWLQIDNPLACIGHRQLLGAHRRAEPQLNPDAVAMSFLSLKKVVATEAAGVLVRRGGGLAVWEYSDMDPISQHLLQDDADHDWLAVERHGEVTLIEPAQLQKGEKPLGLPALPQALAARVHYKWGAINPNLVVVSLESVLAHPEDNPPLVAKKSCKHLAADGQPGEMSKKFIKFEAFLFDGLNDGVVVEEERALCFAPTKNAEGAVDSPLSARALMVEYGRRRLERLGWQIAHAPETVIELLGLLELDDEALAQRVGKNGRIEAGATLSLHGLEVAIGDGLTLKAGASLVVKLRPGPKDAPLHQAARFTLPAGTRIERAVEFIDA